VSAVTQGKTIIYTSDVLKITLHILHDKLCEAAWENRDVF